MTAEPLLPGRTRPRTPAELKRARARQRAFLPTLRAWRREESGEQERNWELFASAMNETRRELGQPPVRE